MSTIYYTHFNEQIRRSGVRFGHVFAQGFENATTADTCLVRWSHLREMLFQTKTAFLLWWLLQVLLSFSQFLFSMSFTLCPKVANELY